MASNKCYGTRESVKAEMDRRNGMNLFESKKRSKQLNSSENPLRKTNGKKEGYMEIMKSCGMTPFKTFAKTREVDK